MESSEDDDDIFEVEKILDTCLSDVMYSLLQQTTTTSCMIGRTSSGTCHQDNSLVSCPLCTAMFRIQAM